MIDDKSEPGAWQRELAMRPKQDKRCGYCTTFFSRYQCAAAVHLECDCPKCQGYCECSDNERGEHE